MADNSASNSPKTMEKKSPISKMLSRSSSLFTRSPKASFDSLSGSPIDSSPGSRARSASPAAAADHKRSSSADIGCVNSIFSSHVPKSRAEFTAVLDSETVTVEELKDLLSNTLSAFDDIKDDCLQLEAKYKSALQQATEKYQATLNDLFVMEQKTQTEDSVEQVQLKLKNLKERTVKIDKERRTFETKVSELERINYMQKIELDELREVAGGSIDEIRMQAVDAKMTRTLFADLANEKAKVEALERERNHDKNHFAEMSAVFDEKTQDFKTRMTVLEEQHMEMSRELTKAEREVAVHFEEMTSYKTALSRTNDRMRQLLETTVAKMEYDEEFQRRKVAEMKVESEVALRKNLERQLEQTHHKFVGHIEELKGEVETATSEYSTVKSQKEQFEILYEERSVEHRQLVEQLDVLSKQLDVLTEERKTSIAVYIDKILFLEQERAEIIAAHDMESRALNLKVLQMETLTNRQLIDIASLHNQVDELKGNIRIFARIRPLLSTETLNGQTAPAVVPLSGGYSLRLGRTGQNPAMLDPLMPDDPENTRSFGYDKVFPPNIAQSAVFEQVSEYVTATMEGHATCLMSYGQTGSGKTFSMQGPTVDPTDERRGIIPRAMEEIVRQMEAGKAQGWSYIVKVSFIQIYMENIHDLLRETAEDVKHEVKKSGNHVEVTDVNMVELDPSDTSQIAKIMSKAAKMRNVASTNQNAESSRSHAIFSLHIHGENSSDSQELDGTMYLVDLAGSERLSKSQASGDTLKETQFINKSLSALGDVFLAIANKSIHVPYRNSKLTYLLQGALSGFHKTLMIVHLSPTEDSYAESLCTMRFASQVNSSTTTSSLRSLSFNAGDQAPSTPSAQRLSQRNPSLTLAAKSPRPSLSTRRPSGEMPTPPISPASKTARGGSFSARDGSKTPDSAERNDQSASTRVRGIAKVFTFDFDDEATSEADDPALISMDGSFSDVKPPVSPKVGSDPIGKKPPMTPQMSKRFSFETEESSPADDNRLAVASPTASSPSSSVTSPPMTRGGSQSSFGVNKRQNSAEMKSPGKTENRKTAPGIARPIVASPTGPEGRKRGPSYAAINAASSTVPVKSDSPSPTKRPAVPVQKTKSKSTF